jgi:hypothetical protein
LTHTPIGGGGANGVEMLCDMFTYGPLVLRVTAPLAAQDCQSVTRIAAAATRSIDNR